VRGAFRAAGKPREKIHREDTMKEAELSFQTKLIGTTGFGILSDLEQGLQKTRESED
jgi:hypothetical protein